MDFSCAIFDSAGELCAQAAHIPVHLGSMAYAMRDIVCEFNFSPNDMLIVNDPFLGGTHLPDITLVMPVFSGKTLVGFAVNRAHHADIGASTPGSMPVSRNIEEEGIIIPPTWLIRAGKLEQATWDRILARLASPAQSAADFQAQISANQRGAARLAELIAPVGAEVFMQRLDALHDYGEKLARHALANIPDGRYEFTDYMDDDGMGRQDIPVKVTIEVTGHDVHVDFTGTAPQVEGNINCPLSVAAAGVLYVFRCLMPPATPVSAGCFRPVRISAPAGCLLNAQRPAAVVAGNVETSSRVVDVVMGALAQAIPEQMAAASQGSMNNVAMGARSKSRNWDYYETLGGGSGAHAQADGLSAVQTHMTNTLNTPIESLEQHYPLTITEYSIRRGSGGTGVHSGGNGLIREYRFEQAAMVTLLTERRRRGAWGLMGGQAGMPGRNLINGKEVTPKSHHQLVSGDTLRIETPGGGGWGQAGN